MNQIDMQKMYWYNRFTNLSFKGIIPRTGYEDNSKPFKVDGQEFKTLSEAIEALNGSSESQPTMEILSNVTLDNTETSDIPKIENITKVVKIVGNGKTLTTINRYAQDNCVFKFLNCSNVSIDNLDIDASNGSAVNAENCNEININGGKYETKGSTFKAISTQIVTMNGVTVRNSGGNPCTEASQGSEFQINNCDFTVNSAMSTKILGFGTYEMLKSVESEGRTNKFTIDGGKYVNFGYTEPNIKTQIKIKLSGTEEVLKAGKKDEFRFTQSYKSSSFEGLIDTEMDKWLTKRIGSDDGLTYSIVYKEPIPVSGLEMLVTIRNRVLSGDTCEYERFIQSEDVDMTELSNFSHYHSDLYPEEYGTNWDGIGVMPTEDGKHDEIKFFKGWYDGNGHSINNLKFLMEDPTSNDDINTCRGLFRCVERAKIENLTVNLTDNAFDESSEYIDKKHGAGGLIGVSWNGVTIKNVTVNGQIGSEEHPTKHTSTGIIAVVRWEFSKYSYEECKVVCENVINNANIYSTRKVGGIIGFAWGQYNFTNVTNNGLITRTSGAINGDGIGGIIAYSDNDGCGGHEPKYHFTNVSNYGQIVGDITKTNGGNSLGQYIGRYNSAGPNIMDGTNICIKSPQTISNVEKYSTWPLWYGIVNEDDTVTLCVPKANGTYRVMGKNVSTSGDNPIIAITLNQNETVTLDEEIGDGNVVPFDPVAYEIVKRPVSDHVNTYTCQKK